MAKFVNLIAGSALIGAGLFLEFVTFGASTPLTAFLISAGIGMVITGIGTLLQKGPLAGTSTATRNPIAPWNVVYGRAKVGGTMVYFGYFGENEKYLDLVIVLACHPCRNVDALLFDGQRIQIDPASGSSFTPLEQTADIFHISRTNDVVTVVLHANIPLLEAGDDVIIQNITGDSTLNGRYPVLQVISQVVGGPGSITFSYVCGGAAASVDGQGQVLTTWPDYRAKVHMEVLLGNHTATFPGMITGTPYDGDAGNLVENDNNPWTAEHKLLGKTAVFLRLHYNDEVFANGIPAITFHISGKSNILDPRTSPVTIDYTENPALCIADYLAQPVWGFRAAYGVAIPTAELIAAANLCDEPVTLAVGGTEPRYTLNGGFPLTMKRGEVLQNLLTSCGGRLTYSGGQFVIHPAGWPGVALELDPGVTDTAGFQWTPRRSIHNHSGIESFDAIARQAGDYHAEISWPGACNVQNLYSFIAYKGNPNVTEGPKWVQDAGAALSSASFSSFSAQFAGFTRKTAGGADGHTWIEGGTFIIVDFCYNWAGTIPHLTVTDSSGNRYWPVVMQHIGGIASWLSSFIAVNFGGVQGIYLPLTVAAATAAALPGSPVYDNGEVGPPGVWHAAYLYLSGATLIDANGYQQRVTSPDGVSGSSLPVFSSVIGGTTTDGALTWTCLGLSGGVGATLTATSNGALVVDGYTPALNDRILVKDEFADQTRQGIYVVSQTGSLSTPYVLTRADDYNTPDLINWFMGEPAAGAWGGVRGAAIPVTNGTVNAGTAWEVINTDVAAIGFDLIAYGQFLKPTITVTSDTPVHAISLVIAEYSGLLLPNIWNWILVAFETKYQSAGGGAFDLIDGSFPYRNWMEGSPITLYNTIAGILSYIFPAGSVTGSCAGWDHGRGQAFPGGNLPQVLGLPLLPPPPPDAPWGPYREVLGYPALYGCTDACDAWNWNGGPHANTFNGSLTTLSDGALLRLVTATNPYCGGAAATLTGPPPLQGFLSIAAGPFRWRSKLSVRDLFNGVKGTYICPGNKWQPSDIPPYAQDSLHGYASGDPEGDANMAADGGDRRWLDIQLPFTISTSAAQRLAKIELMRRRQQGTGTFMFNMALYQTTALDVIQMSLPLLGWVDKLLEISAHRFKLDKVQTPGGEATLLGTEIDVQETDPSVYDWDPSEELSARGYQQAVLPSNITVISNTHQEFLTDGAGNLIFADGDTITVLGVPN
jgi:hypothetical protein